MKNVDDGNMKFVCVCVLNIFCFCRFRDPAYFDENWLNRIKTEVGDNWRLKVFLTVLQFVN